MLNFGNEILKLCLPINPNILNSTLKESVFGFVDFDSMDDVKGFLKTESNQT